MCIRDRYITAFALYGFPESHAASFALLAYASAYLKVHYPAEFYAALLNNQPMGFYHPATLVKDAQHRGQRIRPIDVQCSDWLCTIEGGAVRLGLMYIRGMRKEKGLHIEAERRNRPFDSVGDLQRRVQLNKKEITTLAAVGALNSLGMRRREALWQVEQVWRTPGPLLDRIEDPPEDSPLRDMTSVERLQSDYAGTGMTTGPHPMALKRKSLRSLSVTPVSQLASLPDQSRTRVAGMIIVRQRPSTAKGFLFLSLEDETGIANIIIRPNLFENRRLVLMSHPFLIIDGVVQNQNGVVSVRADRVEPLEPFHIPVGSHDFS